MEPIGSKPTDELIVLARNGSGSAFTALWDRHIGQLRSYIRGLIKNLNDVDVDDICSRSFEKAFRQIESFDSSKSQFPTWLKTIARNTAFDILERESRIHPKGKIEYIDDGVNVASSLDIPSGSTNALDSIINDELTAEKEKRVSRLPALYRDVAWKRLIDGLSYKEIAEELDLELNTVRTRLRRAKDMIAKMAEEKEEE
ncbi:MAG: sigma-70 family RNA polymerase sigma factor [Bacteroidales bacterium]|nr:sigma-70 family RNA polymerase sigma factor [Bacteroidales bacterium]